MTTTGPATRRSVAPWLVLGLTAFFVFIMATITALLIWRGYDDTLGRTRARAEAAAHVVSGHAQWLIEASNQALRRIDRELGPTARSFASASPTLQDELAGLPAEVQLGVYNTAGRRIDNGPATVPQSIADTEYFGPAMARSGRFPPCSSAATGQTRISPSPRIVRGHAVGADVIFLGERHGGFWASLGLGPRSTVSLIRTDGWLIARFPTLKRRSTSPILSCSPSTTRPPRTVPTSPDRRPTTCRTVGYRQVGLPALGLTSSRPRTRWRSSGGPSPSSSPSIAPILLALLSGAAWLAGVMRRDEHAGSSGARRRGQRAAMREIHHRVKNNLQTVSSLVQLQPIPPAAKAEMSRRINAMVSVHEHIYRSDQYTRPEVDHYIKTIIENARQGFDAPVEIVYNLEKLHVDKDNAMPLGLIVSEVVSNAFKHAFPAGRRGRIEVDLKEIEDGMGELVIEDNGEGFDPEAKSQGMGRRLVEGLAAQLTGTFRYETGSGTRFTLQFPITAAEPE